MPGFLALMTRESFRLITSFMFTSFGTTSVTGSIACAKESRAARVMKLLTR